MGYDTKTFLIQTGLDALGYNFGATGKYGKIDGDFGPKTQAAILAFESDRAGKPDAPTGTLAASLVDTATQQLLLNIRETEGKNHGEGIAKFWTATSYPDGYKNREPYCAAFICWVILTAVAGRKVPFSLPRSPVAYDFESWARANAGKGVSFTALPKAGDVFTLATASHCGLVVGVSGSNVITIEANTDATGGREGDGVYKRSRPISTIRQFIRVNF